MCWHLNKNPIKNVHSLPEWHQNCICCNIQKKIIHNNRMNKIDIKYKVA